MKDIVPVKIIKTLKPPTEPGKYFRLLCMTGKNKGTSYFINSKRIVLGRSEKADIQVLDNKSSREHAELALVGDQYILTDLGSQNGVVVNDLKVSQHRLKSNDKIIIGHTVFKYNKLNIKDNDLLVPSKDLEETEDLSEEVSSDKKKSSFLLVICLVAIGVLFLDEEPKKKKKLKTLVAVERPDIKIEPIKDKKMQELDPEIRSKLKAFIHRGQREYRERNYYRAIEQFELALILVPNHVDASFYLRKTKEAAKKHIKQIEQKAQQEMEGLKYRAALVQYCAIIQFYQEVADKKKIEVYINSEKQISLLEEKLGYEKGEFKCF